MGLQTFCGEGHTCFVGAARGQMTTSGIPDCPNCCKIYAVYTQFGASCSAVGWCNELQAGRSRFRFPMVSLEFFINIILPAALWPWGRIGPLTEMSTRNPSCRGGGGKAGRCVRLTTLRLSCADFLEIWEPPTFWNPQGLSRPVMGLLYFYLYTHTHICVYIIYNVAGRRLATNGLCVANTTTNCNMFSELHFQARQAVKGTNPTLQSYS
jgi:hypothetical protein